MYISIPLRCLNTYQRRHWIWFIFKYVYIYPSDVSTHTKEGILFRFFLIMYISIPLRCFNTHGRRHSIPTSHSLSKRDKSPKRRASLDPDFKRTSIDMTLSPKLPLIQRYAYGHTYTRTHNSFWYRHISFFPNCRQFRGMCIDIHIHTHTIRIDMTLSPELPPIQRYMYTHTQFVLVSTWLFFSNCRQFRGMCIDIHVYTHTTRIDMTLSPELPPIQRYVYWHTYTPTHNSFWYRHISFCKIAANWEALCIDTHIHAHTICSGTVMTLPPKLPRIQRYVYWHTYTHTHNSFWYRLTLSPKLPPIQRYSCMQWDKVVHTERVKEGLWVAWIYVCIFVCVHVRMLRMHVWRLIMCLHICRCVHKIHTYKRACLHVCMLCMWCVHVCMYACMQTSGLLVLNWLLTQINWSMDSIYVCHCMYVCAPNSIHI